MWMGGSIFKALGRYDGLVLGCGICCVKRRAFRLSSDVESRVIE